MAAAMDVVEKKVNSDYTFDDVTEEMKTMSVRLYSVLTSYLRNRPLKLVKHIKQENGFGRLAVVVERDATSNKSKKSRIAHPTVKSTICGGKIIE